MGYSRTARADVHLMAEVLQRRGYKALGEGEPRHYQFKSENGTVVLNDEGWTSYTPDGKETDFGSDARDLAQHIRVAPSSIPEWDEVHYVHYPPEDKAEPGNYFSVVLFKDGKGIYSQLLDEDQLDKLVGDDLAQMMRRGEGNEVRQPNVTGEAVPYKSLTRHSKDVSDQDKKFMKSLGIKSRLLVKKADSVVVMRDDQVMTEPMTSGMALEWLHNNYAGSISSALKHEGYKIVPYQGQIKGVPEMSGDDKDFLGTMGIRGSKKKKAVGLSNEGQPDSVCPKCHQPIAEGQMVNYPGGKETHVQCPPGVAQQPGQQAPGWQSRLNLPQGYKPPQQQQAPAPAAKPGMISPNVGRPQASLVAKINHYEKKALFGETSHHHFSFEVPGKAGGAVAFHLAKAGLDNFEANTYEKEGTTEFAFKTEPEMHIAEEIIKAEFGEQISRGGVWAHWSRQPAEDPSMVKPPSEVGKQQLMSSEKTADDDIYRELEEEGRQDKELHEQSFYRGKQHTGPQAVPSRYESALEQALSALETLAEVGPSEDIKGCASMSAGDLRQFAQDAAAGRARKFSAARYEGALKRGLIALTILSKVAPNEDLRDLAKMSADDLGNLAQNQAVMEREEAKQGSIQKQAFDPNLATLIGSWVTLMLAKWLGDQWKERYGDGVAQELTSKAEGALQSAGVSDLATLDQYAQDKGKSRLGAFLALAGRNLAMAAALTTGIAVTKLMGGEAAPASAAAPAAVQVQTPGITIGGPAAPWQTEQSRKKHQEQVRKQKELQKQQREQAQKQQLEQLRQQDQQNPDRSMNIT